MQDFTKGALTVIGVQTVLISGYYMAKTISNYYKTEKVRGVKDS